MNSMVSLSSHKKPYIINLLASSIIVVLVFIIFSGKVLRFSSQSYISLIMMTICVNIILAVSLNLTSGCLGEMVLGHAAFMAIGAYSASLLLKNFTLLSNLSSIFQFIISLIFGFICAGIVGFIIGIPALRLKGDYLAIITLGFGEIVRTLILVFDKVTGGAAGLKKVPTNTTITLAVTTVILVVTVLFTFMRSRHGRAILAIREDDIAAEATGVPVTKYKVGTFAFSAALAGIGGAMFAQLNGSIYPKDFTIMISINFLVIVVLGGLGSFTGSILASIVLITLPELLRVFADYRMVLYSLALIIIMLTRPKGLLGRYEFSLTRFIKGVTSHVSFKSRKS